MSIWEEELKGNWKRFICWLLDHDWLDYPPHVVIRYCNRCGHLR